MKRLFRAAALSAAAFFALMLLQHGRESAAAVQEALLLCCTSVIPALFPFFVISSLAVSLGFAHIVGGRLERMMRTLFHIGGEGASALAIGLVGGYPSGARTADALFREGTLSRGEVQRLLTFCNNAGPSFILGMVGISVFDDVRVGVYLYLTHVLAALLTGVLLSRHGSASRSAYRVRTDTVSASFSRIFTDAVQSSLSAILNVCAFVTFFIVLLRIFELCGFFALPEHILRSIFPSLGENAHALLCGVFEMTSGIAALSPDAHGFICAAALVGWGGLSVHAQTLSLLSADTFDVRLYFLAKVLHAALSALLAHFLAPFLF
ncbi:MAG: sporulation protein [Oscillospiraceae bacterium]|nr:sporulation protein [Oscillospiraceae bacterium]